MKKTEELSGAKLENATFAYLFSSRVFKYYTNVAFTSFALNLLLSIYILSTHLIAQGQFYLCKYIFSFSAKTEIIARSNNSHNLWITLITLSKIRWIPHKNVAGASQTFTFLVLRNWL